MLLNFKKFHPNAKSPTKGRVGDSCYDLYVAEVKGWNRGYYEVDFGIGIELPENWEAVVRCRSSLSKYGLSLCNAVGTIDENYRGSISARFYAPNGVYKPFKVGDRAAQLRVFRTQDIEWIEVSELNESDRGSNGYGSSGE